MAKNKGLRTQDDPQTRIMIRAANWVGDAIMTTPVIRAMKKNFPRACITVLAKPWVIPVYESNPHVDEIMTYENSGRHKTGMGTLRLVRDIKERGFHLAILMQNAFEAALLAFLAGIPERVGYNTDARSLLLNPSVKLNPELKKKHLIDYYLGILRGVGLEDDGRGMDLSINDSDQAWALEALTNLGLCKGRPVIGINPGATGGTAKRWFPERYAGLAEKLSNLYQTKIVIFGGPADHGLGEEILSMSKGACINMAGKTGLSQAFALIGNLDLFITNDSGLMHAAAALNVPQVAVIGSTDYIATAPSSENAVMVRVPVNCSPCLKDECPIDHRCMDRISVEMVLNTCRTILAGNEITQPNDQENHPCLNP
ncbi:lipopolysaccharide heptosyltransferase II [Desulfospira joergensenii]|uniref:lipopolysaccharide heptosyltransferase II n=1 Tax=Desulfospira joergensenii TaxID=53329 RepID=UPI000405D3B3|nr:lipopolysaccharide heptosyltransferase II [Desulfospira joergensenii]